MSTYFAIRPDGSIAQSGSPDSLHAFAQREKYCIWTFNAQGGNLVCAYNPNSPSAPDYPNKASINTMRSGTKWAADSSSRRLRLHRALDCIMDRVGYGRVRDDSRDQLRKKQDELIKLAGRAGYGDNIHISSAAETSPTIGQLKQYIHPNWEREIEQAIQELKTR